MACTRSTPSRFCEKVNYDLLFKWFLDMRIDQPVFDATKFSKNRKRLLERQIANEFFAAVVRQSKLRRYMSSQQFYRGRDAVEGMGVTQDSSRKTVRQRSRRRPQRRGAVARQEAQERHPCVDDGSRGAPLPQEQQARRHAVLLGASVDQAPLGVDRRGRTHDRRRVRRASDRDRDAVAPDAGGATPHRRRRQGLRHQELRCRCPTAQVHAAHDDLGDRLENHPTRRAPR